MLGNAWWEGVGASDERTETVEETSHRDIAVIGMAVRLPKADDVRELWDRVAGRFDAVGPFPASRRKDVESLLSGTKLPGGTASYYDGAYLDEIDKFDCRFFRLSPKEAALMSPNQRLWLETAWSAIEDAGYGGRKLAGSRTGVYIGYNGDAFHDYKRLIAERDPASLSLAIPGNLSSIVAGRISYLLDLKGPAMTLDTACSSSLVALHLAVQALRGGECEQALVGGVKTYLLPVDMGIRIGIESSDFRARTFDDSSSGTGGGEGAAAVLLKPLGKALRDRDAVYAVIKGSAINQDGASIGITAPNGRAQEEAIVRAWQDADIDPETIGYIEAHGTGTRLGDPIEIDGMTRAFERYTDRKQFCAVGSVKTNYGHLDTAAGIVGLVKTALALQHRQLPPMLHFREPNRDIPFADSPVYVSDVLRSWDGGESSSPLRAGVSSFGMSGTNAHAVLEEAPLTEGRPLAEDDGRLWTLALSAKTETALIRMAGSYARFLEEPGGQAVSLRDFCYTANTGRGHYEYRAALTAGSPGELREKLRMLEEALRNPQTSLGLGGWGSVRSLDGIWLGRTDGAAIPMLVEVEEALTFSPEKLCRTYAEGGSWDWETLYAEEDCRKIHLPAYPFDRTRCWVEEEASSFAHYRYPEQSADDIAAMASTAVDPSKRTVRLTGRAEDEYSVTELAVAGAWGSALGFTEIGIGDHYYELGGDSILALRIVGQLSERFGREIGIADLMRHPTVAALSAYIDGDATSSEGRTKAERSGEDTGEETPVSAVPDVHPLSRAQLRIFLASQLAGAELRHHMPLAYAVDGPLDAERLRAAFVKLAERHESLRTTFEWSDEGEPRQRIQPFPVVQVEQSRVDSEAEWPSFAASFVRSFDLSRLPLFRVGVATASPDRHLLLLDTHHLISDGASLALLLQEMTALYDGRALTPKNADYRDFVRWQREQADSPAMRKQRAYWLEEALAGPLPQLRLPLDFPRPKTKTSAGGIFRFTIRTELVEGLQRLAKGRQVSLHTVLFSLYSLLMRRYADQEELIVGSLVNGRDQADFRQTVGVFINFLPVRIRVRKDVSFGDVLDEVQRRTLDAYANGQFPFDEMASALNAGANRSRNPLYDTMLVFHNHAAGGERFVSGGLAFSEYALGRDTSALDVKLDLFPGSGGELRGVIEYDAGLFREATIARLSEHFVELAAAMAEDPDSPVGSIRLFEAEEEADLDRRRKLNDGPLPESKRRLDVRIASTFTSEPVAKPLRRWLGQFGIQPRLTFAPYNQIVQHLLNDESASAEDAAATVLLIRPEDWHNSDNAASADDGLDRLDADLDRIFRLIGERSNNGPHFVALMPFAENGPYGRLPEETVRQFRDRLEARAAAAANASLLDFADTAARYRVHRAYDPVADEEGRIPYTEEYFAAIGTEIARALIGANGHPFKVIVVDADNTLWRGVCGEDGPTGVTVSPSYAAFQQLLLRKRGEGMLLALCSKNNEADLWDVFDRNPGMVLRKEHFSAWRVNWNAKPDNVLSLAEELNLGLDSLIFVDDNAAECLGMMAECPEVLTLKLPEEDEMPAFLARVWAWDRLRVTDEDRMRAANYEAERRRQEAARPEVTLEDYLQSLGLKISMRPLAPEEVERAAQLTVRTNQFNLNGVRRTEKDIRGLMQADGAFVRIVEAADRYGEYGRIGLVSATVQGSALVVDAFLLSCRVLGRGVEQAVCAGLKRFALSRGCTELRAAFRRTAKNRPFERFLEESGWMKSEAAGQEAGEIGEIGEAVPFAILLSQVADVPKHVAYYEGISFATEEAYGQTAAGEPERGPYLPVRESGPAESGIKTYDWLLPFDNEERLLHRAYLLPLRYPEASDVVALPDADGHSEEGSRDPKSVYEAPADETEAAVARLWEKLLGGGPYGRNDHFFDAGGDSLQAASLVSFLVRTFGRRVTLADLFDNARLKQMAALLTGDGDAKLLEEGAIPNAPEAELYPVSSAQRRMYFLQQFEPEGTAYNIPTVLMLTGEIDREKLRRAFRQLEERHEALRTSFVLVDGEPYQRIGAPADIELAEWEVEDGTSVIDGTVGEPLKEALRAFVRPFDLHRAPLFRVGLFRLTENRHAMAFDIHHIVADGVSVNVLMEDFLRLYGGYVLSPPRLQYKDYAVWQRSEKETARREEQLQSWLERFAGPIPKLELPADHPRPSVKSTEGSQLVVSLGKEQTDALNRLAQQTGATPFMVLLSAYAAWLMKLSGQSYVVIGTPVAGRVHPDTEKTVGVFVNPLALRIAADPGHTFERLLAVVKEETLRALERQEAPFEDVVERLRVERDLSRNPLFDTMFSMLNMAHADLSAADIAVKPVPFDFGVSQFDIGLSALEEEDGLALTVQYASKVFRAETMKRWVEAFRILLLGIVEQPAARLADIGLLSDEGRRQVVEAFNDTKAAYPEELTLPEMFRRQAERTPERTAAAFEAERLTYRELDERANRIAWTLLDAGLAPEQPVGLMAERSPEMLAGLLGILKAGGAYVPLPPEFPEERLRFMAEDSGIRLICAQRRWLSAAEKAAPVAVRIDLDDARWREVSVSVEGLADAPDADALANGLAAGRASAASPDGLAYILYTSGSTGRPKGVMIGHRSVVNRLHWMQKAYPLGADDVILQKTPYSFDVSVWELFWWMLAGASVAFLPPGAEKDPGQLIEAIARRRVTTMHFVPSMLAAFLETAHAEPAGQLREKLATLKRVFASGEALHRAHADRFFALTRTLGLEGAKLVNLYGPTEATVDVTVHECEADSALDFVPIGRPIDNTSVYIVGEQGQAQPIGVPGELCIAGVQLARGYANRPELTAEKFVPNPFAPGSLMYRTGDLARWMEDGQVQYLGRIDDQVKIRGYRIELGEIERTLLLHEAVSEAAVAVRDDGAGDKRLVGYVVADRACTSGELRAHCAGRLPDYMIPAAFVQLESMPLTASGKADRKALPEPEAEMAPGTAYAAPESETEEKLVALWRELLRREEVGIDDDFFELGGHSLKAAALTARIEQVFSVRLSLKDVFMKPTVRGLASLLSSGMAERSVSPIPRAQDKPHYPVTSAQKQMLIHEKRNPGGLSYHMPAALLLTGMLDDERLRLALKGLAARHESLRTSFDQADGLMVQAVREGIDVPFQRIDEAVFFGGGTEEWEQAALRWLRPFELSKAPLFRAGLVPLGEDRHLLLFDIHHAVSDGMTNALLNRDLVALYEDRPLPDVKAQFKDYGEWLSRLLSGEERERHRDYWLNRFADGVPQLELPTDSDRAALADATARDEGKRYRFAVSGEVAAALERLARQSGCTLSMVLLASYQAMLAYWSGTPDVVTGVPSAGRSHPDLADTAGLLLQILAIRGRPISSLSFESLLADTKTGMLQAFDHPWLPADELVELLDERGLIRWDPTRHPLYDTMFVMQNMDAIPAQSGDLAWEPLDWEFTAAKTDLVLQAEERGGKLELSFEYRSRLFYEETVAQMAEGLLKFLEQAAAEPQASLGKLTGLRQTSVFPAKPDNGDGDGQDQAWFEAGFQF